MFSFSPRIRLSFWISPSVTLAVPELVTVKTTGTAGTDAGCGAHPPSDRAIATVAPWAPWSPPEEQAARSPAVTTATATAPTTALPRRRGRAGRGETGDTGRGPFSVSGTHGSRRRGVRDRVRRRHRPVPTRRSATVAGRARARRRASARGRPARRRPR